MAVKKELYNVAIAGQGYVLTGTPTNPARTLQQAPVYGNRFASGDRSYTDFSLWWILAQTDWSGGIKQDTPSWADDAAYYYSYNIDAWTEYGTLRLAPGLTQENTFAKNILTGYYGQIGSTYYLFVGSFGSSPATVYRESGGSWSDITGSNLDSNTNAISQLISHKQHLWVLARSSSTTNTAVIETSDGSTFTNHTSAILTALGWSQISDACAADEDGQTIYIAVQDGSSTPYQNAVVKSSDGGSSWSSVFSFSSLATIIDLKIVGTNLFYLVNSGYQYILKVYDTSSSTDTVVWTFYGSDGIGTEWGGGQFLTLFNYKILIKIPRKEIWEYDIANGTLRRVFLRNENLNSDLGNYFYDFRFPGNVILDNKVWFSNLMYDGVVLFNTIKNYDNSNYIVSPLIANPVTGTLYVRDTTNKNILYKTSGYKTFGELIFNRFDIIPTIDKLWHSLSFVFDKLTTGQKITFYYSTDNRSTWNELGGVDYSVDGGSIQTKTLLFPTNTVSANLWVKVKLEGSGSTTPILRDVSVQYLPMPDYKQLWRLQVYCYDDIILLDGKTREPKRGEELRNILKAAWWSKQPVDFHDVDYVETSLNGDLDATSTTITVDSTAGFPEQGRIRIDNEEILYTGKTATTFTGCTRGARGTTKSSHSDGATVSTGYKVLITDYAEKAPVGANAKVDETIVALELREV